MSDSIKTRLEAVSSSLDTAINKANNLPDAGSGGSSGEAIYYTIKINVPGSIPESAHVITYEDVESDGGFTEHYTTAIPLMNYLNDSIEFDVKKGDIFIMCSDGVEKEEIEKWMNLRRCSAIKNEGLNLMQFIKAKKRKDDATILMAKID